MFAVFEAVIIAAFSGSRLFTFVGDYGRAVNSFKAIQVCHPTLFVMKRLTSPPSDLVAPKTEILDVYQPHVRW